MTPHNKPPKELQDFWYTKLKKSGFEDAETSEGYLKQKGVSNSTNLASRMRYFQLAGQFLYTNKFKNKLERLVWTKHSSGFSLREIVKEAKKAGFKTANKDNLHTIVKKLATLMLSQFNSEEEICE